MAESTLHKADSALRAAAAEASLEFGRFRVLLRQRLLLADGVPVDLGTRGFKLLLALLEANGSRVSKEQLIARVWPGVFVAQDNLKAQVSKLRSALGPDRDLIHTESGRGYRFTGEVRSTATSSVFQRSMRRQCQSIEGWFSRRITRRLSHGWSIPDRFGRHCDPARGGGVTPCRH
jgi:DNA-binding winged helix-turn-helix (wHTH) protein